MYMYGICMCVYVYVIQGIHVKFEPNLELRGGKPIPSPFDSPRGPYAPKKSLHLNFKGRAP